MSDRQQKHRAHMIRIMEREVAETYPLGGRCSFSLEFTKDLIREMRRHTSPGSIAATAPAHREDEQ